PGRGPRSLRGAKGPRRELDAGQSTFDHPAGGADNAFGRSVQQERLLLRLASRESARGSRVEIQGGPGLAQGPSVVPRGGDLGWVSVVRRWPIHDDQQHERTRV